MVRSWLAEISERLSTMILRCRKKVESEATVLLGLAGAAVAAALPVDNLGVLYPLQPDRWLVADPDPTGGGGHPKPGAGQVDAEPALGAVGQAVAVPRLAIRHQRP